jgi:hypothetical protein
VADGVGAKEEKVMAVYECEKCGMSIGSITCGQCGEELEHTTLKKKDGTTVLVSQCPEGHGKIKSPMCCGTDMTCMV